MKQEQSITIEANAKINLALDVIGERPNGYHDVRMIMQAISLSDTVTVRRTDTPGITLNCSDPGLPTGGRNLAYRAAEHFLELSGSDGGAEISIEKRIPVAAGLAGGSTDAAAVLKGMNEVFNTGYGKEELCEMGLSLGADVPFCILGGTALAEGIGEKLKKLPDAPKFHVLLVKPDAAVSTKLVYERLKIDENTKHPDVDGMIRAMEAGDYLGVAGRLGNVLEPVTTELCPDIGEIKRAMLSFGCEGTLMSGSGPTVFGLFTDRGRMTAAYMHFKVGRFGAETFRTEFR